MSFLAKLKERLFKSSSKIEEGLDTIIDSASISSENLEKNPKEQKKAKAEPKRSGSLGLPFAPLSGIFLKLLSDSFDPK